MAEVEEIHRVPRRNPAIPFATIADLRGPARQLALVRGLVAAACALLVIVAVAVARSGTSSSSIGLPGVGSMVILDASTSIQPSAYPLIAATLDDLSRSSKHTGLVVFSDAAYEALPPSTPARELEPVARFFKPVHGNYPTNPWTLNFTRGTRISNGIELARDILARNGTPDGGIVLVSDLATGASDLDQLTRVLVELRREHVPVVVVPLGAAPADESYFARLLGRSVVREPRVEAISQETSSRASYHLPSRLVAAGAALLLVLALGERLLARLTWSASTAGGGETP